MLIQACLLVSEPSGTVRENDCLFLKRAGFQAGADLSGVRFANTPALEEDNVNGTEYEGFRSTLAKSLVITGMPH